MSNKTESQDSHYIPANKYYYLGETIGAVPRTFIKVWSLFTFAMGVVVTLVSLYTSFWSWLAYTLFLRVWYITYPAIALGLTYLYLRGQKQKKRKAQQAEILARQKKFNQLINGEVNS